MCNFVVCISVQQFNFQKVISVDVGEKRSFKECFAQLKEKKTILGVKLRFFHKLGMFLELKKI